MERLFPTHEVRTVRECAPIWKLTTLDEGGLPSPEKVTVPLAWEAHPALRCYKGRGVYEQQIRCGGNVRIRLLGVSFRAKVFLDEELLCEHYGAYTAFEGLARDVLPGMHTLRVEVDNRFGDDSALHVSNDYYTYGGITRPVMIEEISRACITACHVTPRRKGDAWEAKVDVTVRHFSSREQKGTLSVQIGSHMLDTDITLAPDSTVHCSVILPCPHVQPWAPEDPKLYQVRTELIIGENVVDDLLDRTGFREIRTEGKEILLNGTPLRLRGFNRHEEYGSFGTSVPLSAMMQDLMLMRDLGANCVRTCHYPNDPLFLDLCDEMGMLVWEESHVRGFSEEKMRHPLFMPQLLQCTREMVEQHMNHPSIFVWGSLNECADDTEYGAKCYREIFRLLRDLDPSRPVTAALLERPGSRVFRDCDIVSINIYPRWYHDTPVRDALEKKIEECRRGGGEDRPLIVSEIGAGAIYGFHDPFAASKWSEERQCKILEEQITSVLSHPGVSGIFLWQFADVRVDEGWFASRPRSYNNKGVVDEYRRPKLAYQTVKDLYHTL